MAKYPRKTPTTIAGPRRVHAGPDFINNAPQTERSEVIAHSSDRQTHQDRGLDSDTTIFSPTKLTGDKRKVSADLSVETRPKGQSTADQRKPRFTSLLNAEHQALQEGEAFESNDGEEGDEAHRSTYGEEGSGKSTKRFKYSQDAGVDIGGSSSLPAVASSRTHSDVRASTLVDSTPVQDGRMTTVSPISFATSSNVRLLDGLAVLPRTAIELTPIMHDLLDIPMVHHRDLIWGEEEVKCDKDAVLVPVDSEVYKYSGQLARVSIDDMRDCVMVYDSAVCSDCFPEAMQTTSQVQGASKPEGGPWFHRNDVRDPYTPFGTDDEVWLFI